MVLFAVWGSARPAPAQTPDPLACWAPQRRADQHGWEAALREIPDAGRLRQWHEMLCSEPHVAGTDADRRMIDRLAEAFERMEIAVERHVIHPYLARPVEAQVEVLAAGEPLPIPLSVRERPLVEDPDTSHPGLDPGWNAFAASGDVTGAVVYANHGRLEDFATLRELGVDLRDRIVVARYGGNYRGHKAAFAEAAGAAGLIIYTDPDDSGYRKGLPYPEGGWANGSSIQRGSILTLAHPGDPLTPFVEASASAPRLDPDEVALPRIPVQPIGWEAAAEILGRMRGPGVPDGWQGGLPFAYRLTGGDRLRVRLRVEQERAIRETANVLGVIPGARFPDELVVVGCHFDAWGFGASDPHAGTIVLLEVARSLAETVRAGWRPARTIVLAHWGAEEHGIIGSVEWCEARRDALSAGGVAYVNLDVAAMGPRFRSSAAPALQPVIAAAARAVTDVTDPRRSVFDAWSAGEGGAAAFGDLGGGSDHVGFYCHLGIPSCGIASGGSRGTAYHSSYDDLAWYRQVVGDDYGPALMLARIVNVLVARLAGADVLPLDPTRAPAETRRHLDALAARAERLGVGFDPAVLAADAEACEGRAAAVQERLEAAVATGRLDDATLARVNRGLMALDRCWLDDRGLPQRPWYRSLYAASDPDSGYAPWPLPLLRELVEGRRTVDAADAIDRHRQVFERISSRLDAVESVLLDATPAD